MEAKEAIIRALGTYGCSTSKQIANLTLRDFGIVVTPAKVSGVLRPLIARGQAANSKDAANHTIYWLNHDHWMNYREELDKL